MAKKIIKKKITVKKNKKVEKNITRDIKNIEESDLLFLKGLKLILLDRHKEINKLFNLVYTIISPYGITVETDLGNVAEFVYQEDFTVDDLICALRTQQEGKKKTEKSEQL